MEPTQDKPMLMRRSFFIKLFSGIVGGWTAGNLISGFIRSTTIRRNKKTIQVTIHPLAVPRTKNDIGSHGA